MQFNVGLNNESRSARREQRDDAVPGFFSRIADRAARLFKILSCGLGGFFDLGVGRVPFLFGLVGSFLGQSFNGSGGRVGLLVWGDPSLYDSTLRIAAHVQHERPLHVSVVPGITSLQVLTAAHRIPLNDVAAPVMITTGRRLREQGWPVGADTVAVMLDGNCAFTTLEGAGIEIWWGAYVGMAQQALVAGPLGEVADQIVRLRAQLRARHGWIMDIYLLRRRSRG